MSTLSLLSNSFADVVDAVAPSVVQVQGRRRPASGVVFRDELVLTTARALGREDGLHVRTSDDREHGAEFAGWDPTTSLVLLRVSGLHSTPLLPIEAPVRVGHLALAIGRSWSNAVTATAGIVSTVGGPLRTGHGRAIERVVRVSAAMHSGFAGGAVVDVNGQLIGVATAAEIRGLPVVIPADLAWKAAGSLAEHGSLGRGYLGVAGQAARLPERQREAEGRDTGLLVVGVSEGSPADAGGVLVGDVITAFDGHPVESPLDLLELLQGERVGRQAAVRVLRGGTAVELTVTVGTRA
jgi:S1-C subfamily serine protease